MTISTVDSLNNWIEKNRLDVIVWDDYTFTIKDVGKFLIIRSKNDMLLDRDMILLMSEKEREIVSNENEGIEYFAFEFGTKWYYSDDDLITELKPLTYLGKEVGMFKETIAFLGIHGGYDICNGSRDYLDWCTKALFCNISTLGIAEENTLAGTLVFQNACDKKKIQSVIGETVTVKGIDNNTYNIKLYVTSAIGWKNLLNINAQLNVFNNKFITEEELFKRGEGLVCVLTPEVDLDKKYELFNSNKNRFQNLFYQFDISQWDSDEKDKKWLLSIQNYLKKYQDKIEPVLIQDAYYLEKEDAKIRKELNAIGGVSFKNQSKDQFFKTPNESLTQMSLLFSNDELFYNIIERGNASVQYISEFKFKIYNPKLSLPEYIRTEEESKLFDNNVDLFWALIQSGLEQKGILDKSEKEVQQYIDRLEEETKVILDAKLHDYFLITWDILNWCDKNGIKRGYGRGSAAGSLVAYLLGIAKINPFEYGLLFERFLNEGRLYKKKKVKGWEVTDDDNEVSEWEDYPTEADAMGFKIIEKEIEIKVAGSMPDVDNDIAGGRRDEVKRYIEDKYGKDRVAGIATYGTFKIKGAIQAFARSSGADLAMTRYVTGAINNAELTFTEFFKYAQQVPIIKDYIQENITLIEKLPLIFNQPSTSSMHAGGVIIVPVSENGIYDQIPVKLVDGILISEWEMECIEQVGVLKMDILGLLQLDKFDEMLKLIKLHTGKDIILEEIPLNDEKTFELFSKGYNEDVFQFGGFGLKGYTQELKPDCIEDLIATVALYRPGPIETQAHKKYVVRKNGTEEIIYPYGCEEILKETYGTLCYQESIMKITQEVAGFTLNEADDIRKAIGKKLPELMAKYKERFIEGAVKNGCPQDDAIWLWDQIEVFGTYSFNKSHAACYAITGYHCQWLKANYPLEFWTVALKYSKDEQVPARLSEMTSTSEIIIAPPEINKSGLTYIANVELNTIYWTISSISQVGPEALKAILQERETNGHFYSIEEFVKRMKPYSRAVKKNTITNLILAGAFDEISQVHEEKERYGLLKGYYDFIGTEMSDQLLEMKVWRNYKWVLKQKEVSGLGNLDFRKLIRQTSLSAKYASYRPNREILETDIRNLPKEAIISGLITKFDIKEAGRGKFAIVEISDGLTLLSGVIWSTTYEAYKHSLGENPIDKLIVLSTPLKFDPTYRRCNVFNTADNSRLEIVE